MFCLRLDLDVGTYLDKCLCHDLTVRVFCGYCSLFDHCLCGYLLFWSVVCFDLLFGRSAVVPILPH